jgi:hypothetical protein
MEFYIVYRLSHITCTSAYDLHLVGYASVDFRMILALPYSHGWEHFPDMVILFILTWGLEVFPYMGCLPINEKTSHASREIQYPWNAWVPTEWNGSLHIHVSLSLYVHTHHTLKPQCNQHYVTKTSVVAHLCLGICEFSGCQEVGVASPCEFHMCV